ncbi:hypothetical protein ABT093_16410 [Kitasatospora sp. NPDC002551]|uniref:hypothetical protein n=1 Tax=Kitasatospora sp. NPDC002551 TaxID=3154539 RepID=UPI00332E7037
MPCDTSGSKAATASPAAIHPSPWTVSRRTVWAGARRAAACGVDQAAAARRAALAGAAQFHGPGAVAAAAGGAGTGALGHVGAEEAGTLAQLPVEAGTVEDAVLGGEADRFA